MDNRITDRQGIKDKVIELTDYLLHKHYCENDVEALVSLFDDRFSWFGTGEEEYATGSERVAGIFRQFAGMVPRCTISDEQYEVMEITPEAFLCTGRLWIATDPSTGVYIRVHQRVAMIFRLVEDRLWCCHIHISNPYAEMVEGDVGFPTKVARQTYEYMQECIRNQEKQIQDQTAELTSIYNTVPSAIMRLLRKDGKYRMITYNRAMKEILGRTDEELINTDWSDGFSSQVEDEDVQHLKDALAQLRHPGDKNELICRLRRSDGETLYVSYHHHLIREDEEGQVIQKIVYDVTRQIEASEELKKKSYQDVLTGLYNRNKFNQKIQEHCYEASEQLGVAYFDLNELKEVNDHLGHSAGDDLICRSAVHISSVFPEETFRIGGDEFVVVKDQIRELEFRSKIENVCQAMKNDHISVSVGLSWRSSGCSIKEQFEEADRRMYENKEKYHKGLLHDRRRRG